MRLVRAANEKRDFTCNNNNKFLVTRYGLFIENVKNFSGEEGGWRRMVPKMLIELRCGVSTILPAAR